MHNQDSHKEYDVVRYKNSPVSITVNTRNQQRLVPVITTGVPVQDLVPTSWNDSVRY